MSFTLNYSFESSLSLWIAFGELSNLNLLLGFLSTPQRLKRNILSAKRNSNINILLKKKLNVEIPESSKSGSRARGESAKLSSLICVIHLL